MKKIYELNTSKKNGSGGEKPVEGSSSVGKKAKKPVMKRQLPLSTDSTLCKKKKGSALLTYIMTSK